VGKATAGKVRGVSRQGRQVPVSAQGLCGQVVATGEAYGTKAAAKDGCEAVQRAANGAEVVEADA
jgi:hypothetical protein